MIRDYFWFTQTEFNQSERNFECLRLLRIKARRCGKMAIVVKGLKSHS